MSGRTVRALKEYCRMNGIENYDIYGTKSSRPSLDRLMGLVKNNQIECVIVFSFSRFARSVTHLLDGLETFRKYNCGFISLSEKLDLNSSLGRAVFVIVGAIAQLERDLISERVKNGLAIQRQTYRQKKRKRFSFNPQTFTSWNEFQTNCLRSFLFTWFRSG